MSECDVCVGMGQYPVINRYGKELYTITCPECDGRGEEFDPDEAARRSKQAEYEAVMRAKREATR